MGEQTVLVYSVSDCAYASLISACGSNPTSPAIIYDSLAQLVEGNILVIMIEWNKMTDHQKYLWRKSHKLNRHCIHCGNPIGDRNTTEYCHVCRLKYNNSSWSLKTKKKISDSMKKAHLDGRAYTIGNNDRKQNVFSRPEKWLNDVLLNNKIKSFSHEIRVCKYFLYFCIFLIKCCIYMYF